MTVRLDSTDILVRNPGIWRFYDDYADTLTPECGTDAGPLAGSLTPLWRRALPPGERVFPFEGVEGRRARLSVHASGVVSVSLGSVLWLINAETGVPTHGLTSASGINFSAPGAAFFVPDGGSLWTNTPAPTLLDLGKWDRIAGPAAHQFDPGGVFTWDQLAPAVGFDGTLFSLDNAGVARALETTGHLRWERAGFAGTPRLDANGYVYWSRTLPPRAIDSVTGQEVWRAEQAADWIQSVLSNSEVAPIRTPIPIASRSLASFFVSLHGADGRITRVIEPRDDAGVPVEVTRTAQSADGVLFLSGPMPGPKERLIAIDETSGAEKWRREFAKLATYPQAGRGGALYLASTECRVSIVDPTGNVTRSALMAGRPTGDLMQLSNGVLFVLTAIGVPLAPGERVWADSLGTRADGGLPRVEEYDCPAGIARLCQPTLNGDVTPLFMLYAFRVE